MYFDRMTHLGSFFIDVHCSTLKGGRGSGQPMGLSCGTLGSCQYTEYGWERHCQLTLTLDVTGHCKISTRAGSLTHEQIKTWPIKLPCVPCGKKSYPYNYLLFS